MRFGDYAPHNFDLSSRAPCVRKALQQSLNVPAVAVLDRIGASRLTARLGKPAGRWGCLTMKPGPCDGLGGVGITLTDLVTLYGGLPRGGTRSP